MDAVFCSQDKSVSLLHTQGYFTSFLFLSHFSIITYPSLPKYSILITKCYSLSHLKILFCFHIFSHLPTLCFVSIYCTAPQKQFSTYNFKLFYSSLNPSTHTTTMIPTNFLKKFSQQFFTLLNPMGHYWCSIFMTN